MIKKMFQIQKNSAWISLIGLLIGYIFVTIIFLIVRAQGDEVEFPPVYVETIVTGALFLLIHALVLTCSFGQDFNMAVSMGVTRRNFIRAYGVVNLVELLAAWAYVNLLGGLEVLVLRIVRGEADYGKLLSMEQQIFYVLPLLLVVFAAELFCGEFIMHFGKTGFWILWLIWMFAFTGLPRIIPENAEHTTVFGIIVDNPVMNALHGLGSFKWMVVSVLVSAVLLAAGYRMYRKQEVTL